MIRVMVGIPTAEMARRAAFYDYYHTLELPVGTSCTFIHGQSIANNRNLIVKQALISGCSHVFFLDDDTAFKPNTLVQLLSHNKDIVTGLHLMRNYPHRPIIFDEIDEKGVCRFHYLSDNEDGLIPIEAAGLGACLIKTKVFSKLEEPWFRLGEIDKDGMGEDLGFFKRVKEIGLKSYCDLTCLIGHMSNTIVWPSRKDGIWLTNYETSGEAVISFPQTTAKQVREELAKI